MTNLQNLLIANMKMHRKSLNLSQAKLAEKIGTATNYLALIESGKKFPSVQMLENIAKALNINSQELFSVKAIQIDSIEKLHKEILQEIDRIINNKIKTLQIFN